jgi:hypothetical protein
MKKLASVLVLAGIILSSFFAQEANATCWNSTVTIQADGPHQGTQDIHKKLIFSEISTETEASERGFSEMDFIYIYEGAFEIRHIKNILSSLFIHSTLNQQEIISLPIFLAVRSIRI